MVSSIIFDIHLFYDCLGISITTNMLIPNSNANSNIMIRVVYSVALFKHSSNNKNEWGMYTLSELQKMILTPNIVSPNSLVRVPPSKCMIQWRSSSTICLMIFSVKNTGSSQRSCLNSKSLDNGCSARRSAKACPLMAFAGAYLIS